MLAYAPNSTASRRQGLVSRGLESMHGQHTTFPPPLPLVSGPYTPQSRDRSDVGGDGDEDFFDANDGVPDPSSTFKDMMDLVYWAFPEAHDQASQDIAPLPPVMQRGENPATAPSLRWSQPISLDVASL